INFDEKTRESISTSFSYPAFQAMRAGTRTLDSVFSYAPLSQVTISSDGQPDLVSAQLVSGNYFSSLHVGTAAGRAITDDDDTSASPVAVISFRYWERHFSRTDVVGKSVVMNGVPLTIIGVTQPGFPGMQGFGTPTDISVPMGLAGQFIRNGA